MEAHIIKYSSRKIKQSWPGWPKCFWVIQSLNQICKKIADTKHTRPPYTAFPACYKHRRWKGIKRQQVCHQPPWERATASLRSSLIFAFPSVEKKTTAQTWRIVMQVMSTPVFYKDMKATST